MRTADDYLPDIRKALATGGHMSIGRGGGSIEWLNDSGGRSSLSGFDPDFVKPLAIAAGLPVIDSRDVPFEAVYRLAVNGPMIAVPGDKPSKLLSDDVAPPYGPFDNAPLAYVAESYRAAGADVHNI